jgi:hypothetical protein
MAFETNVWFTVIATWGVGMFRSVKDEDISRHGHGRNNIRVLRLISRAIHLSFVHNLLSNGNASLEARISSEF